MPDLKLVIGNRNYSSWSLRAWLALEQTKLPFHQEIIWFDEDGDRSRRLGFSPTGRVPVLLDGDLAIWDSLAIGEYLAELAPDAGLWPEAPAARARARSLCAEMHSGFAALREGMPMNVRGRATARTPDPAVAKDIDRVTAMWSETRREFGQGGPLLFGARCLADAFYAPVASRFRTYAVPLSGPAAAYTEAVLDLPAMRTWAAEAESEGRSLPGYDALLRRK
jgi:glutathione S-transferase